MDKFFEQNYNKLHYDLDFLLPGNGDCWIGEAERYRMDKYNFARVEFELDPYDAVRNVFPKGMLDLRDYHQFADCTRLLAYPRLLTLKTVDMIMGDPPNFSINDDHENTNYLKEMIIESNFYETLRKGLIDYSRFGAAIFRIFKCPITKKASITAWDPGEWVPVFYPDGTKRIHYNVLGWRESDTTMKIQIHNAENGSYEERVYLTDGTGALLQILSAKTYEGFGHPLVYALINTPTTTNPFGQSDYMAINALLQKAIERLTAILRVLDEHADPCMTGPHSLLSNNENGELVFKTSKYYAVGQDEKEPKYITWDANLDSSFKAFDILCQQIYIMSEMGQAYLGVEGGTGNVVSSSAMRFKMITALDKARRIENSIEDELKNILRTMLALEGKDIKLTQFRVVWKDSLPKDPVSTATLARLEAGVTSVKPLLHVLMDAYNLDEETAKSWIEELKEQADYTKSNGTTGNVAETGEVDGRTKSLGSQFRSTESNMNPGNSENIVEK